MPSQLPYVEFELLQLVDGSLPASLGSKPLLLALENKQDTEQAQGIIAKSRELLCTRFLVRTPRAMHRVPEIPNRLPAALSSKCCGTKKAQSPSDGRIALIAPLRIFLREQRVGTQFSG